MESPAAIAALSALAHEHRLGLFRLLMRRGPSGMPAGDIAQAIGISPSSLTFHAGALERAGLVRLWRDGRFVYYAVAGEGMRRRLTFLPEDCCDGRPGVVGGLGIPAGGCGGTQG